MKTPVAIFALLVTAASASENPALDRAANAVRLLGEIMASPESAIPRNLLAKAQCVALIPGVKKAAFVVGGRYGKGVLQCRHGDGWTGPSALRLEGGSFGLQIGASSTDIVLLVMNPQGREKLLASKFTLGADAAVAGGPVGRSAQAQTDAQMRAKILSYSRSRGVFAGVSLQGATLRPDHDANQKLYGKEVKPDEILSGRVPGPESVRDLAATLTRYGSGQELAETEPPALPEPPKPARRQSGLLAVTSNPPLAEITLNSSFNGLTPREKRIAPGEYEIQVSKDGFTPVTQTVVIPPGETVELHAELTAINVEAVAPDPPVDDARQARRVKPASNARIQVVGVQ